MSGSIPDAYTCIERSFCNKLFTSQQQDRITLYEYSKPGWTVHAKGLWYHLPNQPLPAMTMVGSPNFGKLAHHIVTMRLLVCLSYLLIFISSNK